MRSLVPRQNGAFPQGYSISLQQRKWLRVTCWATNIANSRSETNTSKSTLKQPGIWASWEIGSMAGRGLPMFGDRKSVCRGGGKRRERRHWDSELLSVRPSVTGLSQPRGKVTHRTAQWGAINVRPSPSTVVMADKRLSGSSRSQSTPDTCAALCYVLSEGKTPTRTAEILPGSNLYYNPPDSHAEMLPCSYSAILTITFSS